MKKILHSNYPPQLVVSKREGKKIFLHVSGHLYVRQINQTVYELPWTSFQKKLFKFVYIANKQRLNLNLFKCDIY